MDSAKESKTYVDLPIRMGDGLLGILSRLGIPEADTDKIVIALGEKQLLNGSAIAGIKQTDQGDIMVFQNTGITDNTGKNVVRFNQAAIDTIRDSLKDGWTSKPDEEKSALNETLRSAIEDSFARPNNQKSTAELLKELAATGESDGLWRVSEEAAKEAADTQDSPKKQDNGELSISHAPQTEQALPAQEDPLPREEPRDNPLTVLSEPRTQSSSPPQATVMSETLLPPIVESPSPIQQNPLAQDQTRSLLPAQAPASAGIETNPLIPQAIKSNSAGRRVIMPPAPSESNPGITQPLGQVQPAGLAGRVLPQRPINESPFGIPLIDPATGQWSGQFIDRNGNTYVPIDASGQPGQRQLAGMNPNFPNPQVYSPGLNQQPVPGNQQNYFVDKDGNKYIPIEVDAGPENPMGPMPGGFPGQGRGMPNQMQMPGAAPGYYYQGPEDPPHAQNSMQPQMPMPAQPPAMPYYGRQEMGESPSIANM